MKDLLKQIQNCKKCGLYKTRIMPTIYCGNIKSKIMFIGEAPGKTKTRQGCHFAEEHVKF